MILAAYKKSTEEGEQSLCTSNQEKQSSQIYKLFINWSNRRRNKRTGHCEFNSNAEGKARNLNIYTYNKGKVKKIWSTSDQIIAYNKNRKQLQAYSIQY